MVRPAALILAGGRAERLGGAEKPLIRIGGRTILERILAALGDDVAAVALSANGDPSRYSRFGLPVLPDGPFAGQGPLAGLLAGLDWAATLGAAELLSLPGDTPFLPPGLAARLAPAPAVAASGSRRHHLVALWPVTARTSLAARLAAPGSRAVAAFAVTLGPRVVEFPASPYDPFLNINTPDDLARGQAIAEAVAGPPALSDRSPFKPSLRRAPARGRDKEGDQ
jgi:molybdenum cofactor guanylyltransferase